MVLVGFFLFWFCCCFVLWGFLGGCCFAFFLKQILLYLRDAWITFLGKQVSSDFRNAAAGCEETALWLILISSAVFPHCIIKFAWGLLLVANYLAPLQNCLLTVGHAMLLLVLQPASMCYSQSLWTFLSEFSVAHQRFCVTSSCHLALLHFS